MDLLLVAFGTFFLVEFAKTVLPGVPPWGRLVAAMVAASALAYPFDDRTQVALAFAGAGLAGLIQKVHRAVSAAGDVQQVRVLTSTRPRF